MHKFLGETIAIGMMDRLFQYAEPKERRVICRVCKRIAADLMDYESMGKINELQDSPTGFGEQADSDNAGRVHASPAGQPCTVPQALGRGVCPAVTTGGDPAGRADARPSSGRAECSSPPRRDSGRRTIVTDRFALLED
jgi:hypothetical protein